MNKIKKLSACFLALTGSSAALAGSENPATFCDARVISNETEVSKSAVSDENRFHEMDRLYREISILMRKIGGDANTPAGLIKNCLQKKSATFSTHVQSSSSSTRSKNPFHFIIGQYLELQGRTKDALDHYLEASRIDPNDYVAAQKAFQIWFVMESSRLTMAAKNAGTLTRKDLDNFMAETNRFLTPVVSNPKAPKQTKIDFYRIRATALEGFDRPADAMSDWKQILAIDPANEISLTKLAVFELERGRKIEGRKYLEQLAPLKLNNARIQQDLIQLQLDSEDFVAALRTADAASKALPSNVSLKAMHAQALAGNGRIDEAAKIIAKISPSARHNPALMRSKAFIHRLRGEHYSDQKLPGKALAEFEASLLLNPADKKLRVRMGTLLFEYRQDMNFKPPEASRQDLDRAAKLLAPLLKGDFIEQRTLEVFISSAARSTKPSQAAAGCQRYRDEFGSLPSIALVLDCATGYKSAGQQERARKTLEDALMDPRFKHTASQITSALAALR